MVAPSIFMSVESLHKAQAFLVSLQNKDGGWGYTAEKRSYAEPTAYSLLALTNYGEAVEREQRSVRTLQWLAQQTGGAGAIELEKRAQPEVDSFDLWGTIITYFVLTRLKIGTELSDGYLKFLMKGRGNKLSSQDVKGLNLDPTLQGWSWVMGTASWVEPTAYALLALKSNGMREDERVKMGQEFLFDRACYEGGWNYGNKEVLAVKLDPMPTNTCFALLALQDADRQHETIRKSLAYLERELAERQSTMLLALGTLCLNIYGRPTRNLVASLIKRQSENGSWRDNVHLTSLAALALESEVNQHNIFKL